MHGFLTQRQTAVARVFRHRNDMANVTIDGIKTEVKDGTSILHAANDLNIEIPTFCYQEKLPGRASCRMCLIEVEGQKKLQPSCVTPVLDGMVVNTASPVVQTARTAMLEFILANHPLECPVCDKAGECELQDMVFTFGQRKGVFSENKFTFHNKDYVLNSVIIKNAERCIQCQRCVRTCSEIVGSFALGAIGRGVNTEETGFARSLDDCDHCGNCIEVCPVGSLMNLPYRFKSRPWDLKEVDTICPYCGTGCQLTIGLRDGELVRVRSKRDAGVNEETLCVKGRFGIDYVIAGDRVKSPMIRRNGSLEAASWDEVGAFLRPKLEDIVKSKAAVGGVVSARLSNENLYGFQKFMRGILKTNNIDSSTRWNAYAAKSAADIGLYTRMTLPELFSADTVVVIGGNVTEENPVSEYVMRRYFRERGFDLFVVSNRPSRLDAEARASARILPGDEVLIVSRMLRDILSATDAADGLNGIGELKKAVNDADLQPVDCHDDFLQTLVPSIGNGKTISFLLGTDLLRSAAGGAAILMLGNLARILKKQGKEVRLQFLFDRANQLGAWDMGGVPYMLPGYVPVGGKAGRDIFEDAWQTTLPGDSGLDFSAMIEQGEAGKLSMLYVVGENPVLSYPDGNQVEAALSKIDLLIVQDAFMTETAALADVVLPATTFAETTGTMTGNEGRVQKLERFFTPPNKSRTHAEIFSFLANLLGQNTKPQSPDETFREIAGLVSAYKGMSADDLGQDGRISVSDEFNAKAKLKIPEINVSSGKGFRLITGNSLFHSGYTSSGSDILVDISSAPYVEVSSGDAQDLGIENDEEIIVKSDRNVVQVKVKINGDFPKGVVFIPENFKELKINRLFKAGEYPCQVELLKR